MEARVPAHVAIIMDGNGRWAQRRGHPRVYGHVRGVSRIKPVVREAERMGVRALTLYAFSTENWSRPEAELGVLWKLLKRYLRREADDLHRHGVRLRVIGEVDRLGADVREVLDPVVARLSGNTGLQLTFAVSYGSRRELGRAARLLAQECAQAGVAPATLTDADAEARLGRHLWTSEMGALSDVDLVVRTSGEQRVSNFLLWQAAYAEFVFLDLCWPDFAPRHLAEACQEFARRERRFGGVDAGVKPLVGSSEHP